MKKTPQPQHQREESLPRLATGVAWYTQSAWSQVKATASDPERFEATYDEWVAMANEALETLNSAGAAARKVLIDPEEFLAWCQKERTENSAAARSRFVSGKLRSLNSARGA